jgi:5-methylcytosine-specific restriction protein B
MIVPSSFPVRESKADVFKIITDHLTKSVLAPRGLTIRSCGTKNFDTVLKPINPDSGFWSDPQKISSKPPRWLLQIKNRSVDFSKIGGQYHNMAKTVGFVNNARGDCAVCLFRVVPIISSDQLSLKSFISTSLFFPMNNILSLSPVIDSWSYAEDWEFFLLLTFNKKMKAGTSGDPMTNFDPAASHITLGASTGAKVHEISHTALIKLPAKTKSVFGISYDEAAKYTADFCHAEIYDGCIDEDISRLIQDVEAVYNLSTESKVPFFLSNNTSLIGVPDIVYQQINAAINSGKRHIIFYGPPGTGKTTLSEYLAREVSEHMGANGSYLMLTASSAWSSQDLIGGYQPLGNGQIGFIPGALLRNFDKPIVIDELNRCPIDKVIGPLFSVLSGQATTLPYRVTASDPLSEFHTIFPEKIDDLENHQHAPDKVWRLICSLNTYDKTQLGQISYALSRRFAWIKIGIPDDLNGFVETMASREILSIPDSVLYNPIGEMWLIINKLREVGGAPIVDFLKTLKAINSNIDVFSSPEHLDKDAFIATLCMCILPLMDGLSSRELLDIAKQISEKWGLNQEQNKSLEKTCLEFAS